MVPQTVNNVTGHLLPFTFFLCLFYTVFCVIKKYYAKIVRLPPGPSGVPGLGYLPFLGTNPHQTMFKLAEDYGDIFSIKLGQRVFVVLSDPKLIRESFNLSACSGRPMTPLYGMFNGFGVINTRGQIWREERRFLVKQFIKPKDSGCIERIIKDETEYLLGDILKQNGLPMDLDHCLTAMSTNVITSFMVSMRYDSNNPIFLNHKKINGEGFELFAKLDMVNYIWILKFLPGVKENMKKLQQNHNESMEFFRQIVRDRKKTFQPGDENDVLDSYLNLAHNREDTIKNFEEQVAQVLCDLVSAGGESTKTTLLWAMLYLIHNPHVYEEMRTEIDRFIDSDRLPGIDDKTNLIYCHAVINEVLRCSNVVPVAPNHATESDVVIRGYDIPKGSSIVALLYNCHTNSQFWSSPKLFKPERFIVDGKVKNQAAFMPFGKGLRACLGDTLAMNELFIVLTAIIQNFDISIPPNTEKPSMNGVAGVTLRPENYKICLSPREKSYVRLSRGI